MKNINTKSYWDNRFKSGDWENKSGRKQTQDFATSQIVNFNIPANFSGSILDFGCALGDAIPIYKKHFPFAQLYGIDISEDAIKKCREQYGELATFIQGTHEDVPPVDIIIASNVFEHLSNDIDVARVLFDKCKELYIIVPYNEDLKNCFSEHVNSYQIDYFKPVIDKYNTKVFSSRGWSQFGWNLYVNVWFKNLFRPIFGKKYVRRSFQIMYHLKK